MSHNYYDTFIAVAPDYEGETAKVPQPRGKSQTIAEFQYAMLIDEPFVHTQEDVLFETWRSRQSFEDLAADELEAVRAEFFSTGRACLRASPLTKSHGWGVAFDTQGRAALVAVESDEYKSYEGSGELTLLPAMRSKRK